MFLLQTLVDCVTLLLNIEVFLALLQLRDLPCGGPADILPVDGPDGQTQSQTTETGPDL